MTTPKPPKRYDPPGSHVGTGDRFSPLGHFLQEVSGSYRGPKRFVYDADVRRVVEELRRRFPSRTRMDSDAHLATSVSYHIYKLGPENPNLTAAVALDLCLIDGARA